VTHPHRIPDARTAARTSAHLFVPGFNPQRFVDLCADLAATDYQRQLRTRRRAFFDRGLIDIASAVEQCGLQMPQYLTRLPLADLYASPIFMSPPWEELFENDFERRHTFSEAVAEYRALVPFYEHFGYDLAFLPRAAVDERVAFILNALNYLRH
jgi:predicted ATPase